jgi:hypothetical protein
MGPDFRQDDGVLPIAAVTLAAGRRWVIWRRNLHKRGR